MKLLIYARIDVYNEWICYRCQTHKAQKANVMEIEEDTGADIGEASVGVGGRLFYVRLVK